MFDLEREYRLFRCYHCGHLTVDKFIKQDRMCRKCGSCFYRPGLVTTKFEDYKMYFRLYLLEQKDKAVRLFTHIREKWRQK